MPQYCFYTEQCKYTSEEQQQGDTVALNMDSVPFSAGVLMAHCSCPKTPPLCSGLWVMLHRLFITESPFTPLYSLLAYSHLFPSSHSVSLQGLQTHWCHPPPASLMGATSAGQNHILPEMVALENSTWLQLLDMVVVFLDFQSVTYYLPSAWQLLWWLYLHVAPAAHSWCGCSYICCHNMADIAQK